MKKVIIILGIILFAFTAKAQQDPQYTHYMYNMNIVNPAYAGSLNSVQVNFLARTQWVGIDGAPETLTFGIHAPVGKNLGLGFSVIADKIGPVKEQNVYGDISYTLDLNNDSKLAFGIKLGATFFDLCVPCLRTVIPNDVAFYSNNQNSVLPNFGVGAFYYTDSFYLGFSSPNLLQSLHFRKNGGQIVEASEVSHMFLTSGYVFPISRDIKLKPSVMVKATNGAPLSVDFSGNLLFNNKFEAGLSYRLSESVSALVNFRASTNLRIGYAYDHTLTDLGQFNSGSHEIMVLYNFDFNRTRIRSPRFF